MEPWVVGGGFGLLALAHSVLGERELLRPLFAQSWTLPIPRRPAELIFRFAWHITSVAWLGLAAAALGVSVWAAVFGVAVASGSTVFVMLRGHLAWPIFFLIAGAAGRAQGWVGPTALQGIALISALGLLIVAGMHAYWALGGKASLADTIPVADGRPLFTPPAWVTAGVGLALLVAAGLQLAQVWGWAVPGATGLLWASVAVFALRAIGEGRFVGFTKSRRNSRFAQLDDRLYTPLSFLFASGGLAALML